MTATGARLALLVALSILAAPLAGATQQQPAKIHRIGYLTPSGSLAFPRLTEQFRHGLRELGYVEGRNLIIEYRSADGKPDRLPALAAELVALKVDVIVTGGGTLPALRRSVQGVLTFIAPLFWNVRIA